MRCLLVGGFERSGHDAAVSAIQAAGLNRQHDVESFHWRDHVDLELHPIFHLHRLAAEANEPHIASLMEADWVDQTLAEDLWDLLELSGFDLVVSAHPWSTSIVAEALVRMGDVSTRLVDYTGELGGFPLSTHPRVDRYFGGGALVQPVADVRARCIATGVVVRPTFSLPVLSVERRGIVVLSGATGSQFRTSLIAAIEFQNHIGEIHPLKFICGQSPGDPLIEKAEHIGGEVVIGEVDISQHLAAARWCLTKASGSSLAEALAVGCWTVGYRSGVPWEDAYLGDLVTRRVVAVVGEDLSKYPPSIFADGSPWEAAGRSCRMAAEALWKSMEILERAEVIAEPSTTIAAVRTMLRAADYEVLPNTTAALTAELDRLAGLEL